MSREPFENLGSLAETKTKYQPPETVLPKDVIETMLEEFMQLSWADMCLYENERVDLSPWLSDPQINPDLCIDNLLQALLATKDPDRPKYGVFFIRPVVQELFERGHDTFTIDYRDFEWPNEIANHFHGEEGRPMRLRYLLPAWISTAARKVEHVRVAIEGKVGTVGPEAQYSSIYLDSLPLEIGNFPKSTSFYLDNVEDVRFTNRNADRRYSHPVLLAYLPGGDDRRLELGRNFYLRDNRLFIRSEDKDWREVTP